MNRKVVFIALALFVLPLFLRLIWFFPGFYQPHTIATPDYAALKLPVAPVSTSQVNQVKQVGGVVIIDNAHSNQFEPSEIQTLVDALGQRGARVELNTDSSKLESQLKYASAYLIFSPYYKYTSSEMQVIQNFIGRGGRMAVFTDPTRGLVIYDDFGNPIDNIPDTTEVNPLVEPFGITFNSDYLYNLDENEGNFRNVYFESFGKSDLTWGLKKVALYGTHSVETDSGLTLMMGDDKTYSSDTDATPNNDSNQGWAAAALDKTGSVLAVGDFTFLSPPYNTVGDNAVFINNIADFLLGGTLKYSLADFPYLFSGTSVDILPTSNIEMTANLITAISKFQSSYKAINTQINIVQDSSSSQNLIVLGTFAQANDLNKFVKPFNITMSDANDYVELPGFGQLGKTGNAILLFSSGNNGNTLVLLADTEYDLTSLISSLSDDDLSKCVLQGEIGVCSIGFGGSFSTSTATPSATTPAATPTPTSTPTPG